MRTKVFMLCVTISLLLIMASCKNNAKKINEEYTCTEIEVGFSALSLVNDVRTNSIYVLGGETNSAETSIITIDTETFKCSDFGHTIALEEGQEIYDIHPNPYGYWVHAIDTIGENDSLSFYSHDFVLVLKLDLGNYLEMTTNPNRPDWEGYSYQVCGARDDGNVVIWDLVVETLFALNTDGDVIQTWRVTDIVGSSKKKLSSVIIYANDIYTIATDFMIAGENKSSTDIKKLFSDGSVDDLYTHEDTYRRHCTGYDGRIYATNFDSELYVFNDTGEAEYLFDLNHIRANSIISGLLVLSEDKYVALIDNRVFLTAKDGEGMLESLEVVDARKELTLACYDEGSRIRQSVYAFNNDNETYKIEILDYAQFEDGVSRLNLDILAGNAPDMIYWGGSFMNQLQSATYSKAGQLVDLYTLLDHDTEISRSMFLPNLLEATNSNNGALYELPLEFYMFVVAGKADVVGMEPGWTPDEFFEFLKQYPEADNPFGTSHWRNILSMMIHNNSETFIDWENSKCYFDSDEFINLLDIVKINVRETETRLLPVINIKEGRQLLSYNTLSDVSSIQKFTELFGGAVNFIGFPTAHGIGNAFVLDGSVSILVQSENVDACWQFLRGLVTYEEQIKRATMFPANYAALQERLNHPAKYEESGASILNGDDEGNTWSVTFTDATPEESAQVRQLIESCDRVHRESREVMTIIEEEAPSYFNGDKTAEEVARIIQARVQTYVSEQK